MTDYVPHLKELITSERAFDFIRAGLIFVIGTFFVRLISRQISKAIEKKNLAPQHNILARKIVFYSLEAVIIMSALREVNFKLSVLLGAAGILTVALGFASQTSVSNIISGLFLLIERPFKIGDVIKIGTTEGVVDSIELLSTKLRTFQNGLVRIPNEILIKTEFLNHTHFPIRRIDIEIGVAYKENIAKVKEVLFRTAAANPLCLEEPAPLFVFVGYGESSIDLKFCVWVVNDNYLDLMNSIKQEIKEAFDAEGIEIPFPQRTISTGYRTNLNPSNIEDRRMGV